MTDSVCPECGVLAKPGKKFCGKCGTPIPVAEALVGRSKVSLDADALNLVLKNFASKPDGLKLAFEDGVLQCEAGDVSVNLKGLSLQDTEMNLKHKSKGAVNLTIKNLSLSGDGAQLQVEIGSITDPSRD